MNWRLIYVLLFIGLSISLIEPVRYYFTDKTVTEMPKHTSYEEAVDSLKVMIEENASKHNCTGYVTPLTAEDIGGHYEHLPNFIDMLNCSLLSYDSWSLQVDRKQKEVLRKRFDENMKRWGVSESIGERLETQKWGAFSDYSVRAALSPLVGEYGNDLQLVFTVISERDQSDLFRIPITFANPETVVKWEKAITKKQEEIEKKHQKNRMGIFSTLIFVAITLLLSCFLLVTRYIKKKKYDNELMLINSEIEKRQDLIDNGHFVAALELADRFLQYFPNDTDIKAFRERLLDYTNNDPKRAQIAYVEYMKIQARLSKPLEGTYLTEGEKIQLLNLLPYHPKLAESYPKLISYEDDERKRQELRGKLKKVKELSKHNKLNEIDLKLKELENHYPPTPELASLRDEINERIETSRSELSKIVAQIPETNLVSVKNSLKLLLENYQDFKEAQELLSALENKSFKNGFKLVNVESNREIKVLNKSEIILGREEEGVHIDVALNERYISRPHLKIVLETERIVIEDLESSGGSYVNGEKITKHTLQNGELLTLGKIIDVDFLINKTAKNGIGGMIINLTDDNYILVKDKVTFDLKNDKITNGDYCLFFKDGIALLTSEELQIIRSGIEIEIGNSIFKATDL